MNDKENNFLIFISVRDLYTSVSLPPLLSFLFIIQVFLISPVVFFF